MAVRVISVVNQKGGVGKTTTAVNLATIFALMSNKVLLVDVDSQGNASSGMGIPQKDRTVTSYDVFSGLRDIEEVIIGTVVPGLDVISANTNLAVIELELARRTNPEFILKRQLDRVRAKYDYIIIDCPPSLNLITLNALVSCDEVMIPMLCDFYSLEGLSHLLRTIEFLSKKIEAFISLTGILFTMYDGRSTLTHMVENDVRGCLGNVVFKTTIPRNVRVAEAPSYGKSVLLYDAKCSGAIAYVQLAKEIVERDVHLRKL